MMFVSLSRIGFKVIVVDKSVNCPTNRISPDRVKCFMQPSSHNMAEPSEVLDVVSRLDHGWIAMG